MLNAHALAERPISEVGHVASGIDIRVTSAEHCIHDDAIVHFQACRLRQRDVRRNPDPANNAIDQQFAAFRCLQRDLLAPSLEAFRRFAGQHLDAVLPVVGVQERR